MSQYLHKALSLLLLATLLAASSAAEDARRLWSRFDVFTRPVIEQTRLGRHFHLSVGPGTIGQTFVAREPRLERLDYRADNRHDRRPGRVAIYVWKDHYSATVAGSPIFSDWIDHVGPNQMTIRSHYPGIDIEIGARYLIQWSAPERQRFILAHSNDPPDPYPDGNLFIDGKPHPKKHWDVWFRILGAEPKGRERHEDAIPRGAKRWSPSPYRRSASSFSDYLPRVRAYADHVRATFRRGCPKWSGRAAHLESALYRASCHDGSCKEKYAEAARDMLVAAHRRRFCEAASADALCTCAPDEPVHHDGFARPELAYAWILNSPSVGQEDHRAIRSFLGARAAALWSRLERGTHNRVLALATTFAITGKLLADHPDASRWRHYAEEVWSEMVAVMDTEEDSSEYVALGVWPGLLGLARALGHERELFEDTRFRRWVERAFDQITPMGAVPNFGHSVGWSRDPSGLVWLLEASGAHYQEPKYRWLARKIFQYNEDRSLQRPPSSDSLQQTLPHLIEAHFAADTSVTPAPPLELSENQISLPLTTNGTTAVGEFDTSGGTVRRIILRNSAGFSDRTISIAIQHAEIPHTVEHTFSIDTGTQELELPFFGLLPEGRYEIRVDGTRASDCAIAVFEGYGSTVTRRLRFERVPEDAPRDGPRREFRALEGTVPDKLVLRSGADDDDMYAMFNLVQGFGHGQEELGGVVTWIDRGSVLLADGPYPYWIHHPNERHHESVPYVRRRSGFSLKPAPISVRVPHWVDTQNLTVSVLQFRDVSGWDIDVERTIFFVKNRFLWVRDEYISNSVGSAAIGPIWQVETLGPDRGHSWFQFSTERLLGNVWYFRNPRRFGLLHFAPKDESQTGVFLDRSKLVPDTCETERLTPQIRAECRGGPTYTVYQRWSGEFMPGERHAFGSLLVSHGDETDTKQLAGRTRNDKNGIEFAMGDEEWRISFIPCSPARSSDPCYTVLREKPNTPDYLFSRRRETEAGGITVLEENPFDHRKRPNL